MTKEQPVGGMDGLYPSEIKAMKTKINRPIKKAKVKQKEIKPASKEVKNFPRKVTQFKVAKAGRAKVRKVAHPMK